MRVLRGPRYPRSSLTIATRPRNHDRSGFGRIAPVQRANRPNRRTLAHHVRGRFGRPPAPEGKRDISEIRSLALATGKPLGGHQGSGPAARQASSIHPPTRLPPQAKLIYPPPPPLRRPARPTGECGAARRRGNGGPRRQPSREGPPPSLGVVPEVGALRGRREGPPKRRAARRRAPPPSVGMPCPVPCALCTLMRGWLEVDRTRLQKPSQCSWHGTLWAPLPGKRSCRFRQSTSADPRRQRRRHDSARRTQSPCPPWKRAACTMPRKARRRCDHQSHPPNVLGDTRDVLGSK